MRLNFLQILIGCTIATKYLEAALIKVINQHFVQLLRKLKNASKDVHLVLEDARTVSTSWSWLRGAIGEDDLFPGLRL